MWLLGRIIYWCLLYQITGANYLICRHFKIRHILSVLQALLYTFGARIIYILFRSWYNHSSSFTIASVRIENHLGSWRRHQVLASWQSSQLNLVLPQSSCSTLVKISGRMLLVRLPGKPPNTRGGGKIHAADSKAWSLQEITSLDEDFSLEENSSLEDASVLRKTSVLRKRKNDTTSTTDKFFGSP